MRQRLEFIIVWVLVRALGALPRSFARTVGAGLGAVAFAFTGRLRRTGERNLQIAYPESDPAWRTRTLRQLYRNLGLHLAEFCRMARYTPESTRSTIRYAGLEHYLAARDQGRGVLVVTGHLGLWELSSFYHSLMGYPMSMVIRRLDNPLVDRLVNGIRCLHGNTVLHKDDFARGLLGAMRRGDTVGILMDTNMTPPQGVFVDFFGTPACTASGLARVGMRTGAAMLPGFLTWREEEKKYVLEFGERLELICTGNDEQDMVTNTQLCTTAIEAWVRRYPEQWLWVHRRWKTRPAGEPSLYS
ncbi:MAG TPA: lysophospholipid acyltransferase family protein [Acidobacteriaceae bacterium]|jgi:KDO2-lipid IV(A) lauroyltransferase|nr:lysophospholipid acyltransferase family protein [Acidobacteriaceae bacterium]